MDSDNRRSRRLSRRASLPQFPGFCCPAKRVAGKTLSPNLRIIWFAVELRVRHRNQPVRHWLCAAERIQLPIVHRDLQRQWANMAQRLFWSVNPNRPFPSVQPERLKEAMCGAVWLYSSPLSGRHDSFSSLRRQCDESRDARRRSPISGYWRSRRRLQVLPPPDIRELPPDSNGQGQRPGK